MLKKRAGRNGKPSSRREQPNRQLFSNDSVVGRNRPTTQRANGYASTSSEGCLTLSERLAPGKEITSPLPDPTAICVLISGIRLLFFAAATAHLARLDFRVPGRR
jgi:hypothetical protein